MTTLQFVQGLLDWLLADPSHIVAAAAALAAATPTPNPATPMGKLYKVLEILAFNFMHAKEGCTLTASAAGDPAGTARSGDPGSPLPPTSGPGQPDNLVRHAAMIAAVLSMLGMTACAAKPPATQVFETRAAYDAGVLAPMASYASLPACTAKSPAGAPTAAPVCTEPAVLAQLRKADTAAKATLDAAETTVRQHPTLDASAAIAAAQNAVTAARTILTAYNIK